MILWMRLKNLALVEEAEIEFAPGYNVISGETGAGKSVIMGGVALLLGNRADRSAIRAGTDKCEIAAEFRVPDFASERIGKILADAGVTEEGESAETILIRRVISPSSTRNFINSVPVALPVLKALGELLIDVHAANENQSLFKSAEQLRALDRFAALKPLQNETAAAWRALEAAREKQRTLLESMPGAEETERMRREVGEITKAAPEVGEDTALSARHALAANARTIVAIDSRTAAALTEGEDSLFDHITTIRRSLAELEKYDQERAELFVSQLDTVSETISDLSASLLDHAADVELDEGEFMAMEERMGTLQTLKRRYGPTLDDVLAHAEKLRAQIDLFDNAEQRRKEVDLFVSEQLAVYKKFCEKLSAARRKAADKLIAMLTDETVKLGFAQAEFRAELGPAEPGPNGTDRLTLFFSANPGVPPKPLKDVASSGEISRVMLAMKAVLAEADEIPVLIFDEIDTNIGGETAMRVGSEIAKLGHTKQVICISHLPQTVRLAEKHFLVSKSSENGSTLSRIEPLDAKGRLNELARMLGGGKAALGLAKDLLASNS